EEAGRVVREAELLLRRRLPEAIVLRFAGIYGPGRLLRQKANAKGEPITADAERWLSLIQVDDGAAAVQAAAEGRRPGLICNICEFRPERRCACYSRRAKRLAGRSARFLERPPGEPLPPHERAHRRIVNRRMHEVLRVHLRYPGFEEGLPAAVAVREGE